MRECMYVSERVEVKLVHFISKQVELYCNTRGLSIVGYYHANERFDDVSVSDTAKLIAGKIASNCENKACLLLVSPLVN